MKTNSQRVVRFPVHALTPDVSVTFPTRRVGSPDEESGNGWFLDPRDLSIYVERYSHLHLKEGFKLVGYTKGDCMGGRGVVRAVPVEVKNLSPLQCQFVNEMSLQDEQVRYGPYPESSLTNVMEAIDGDGHPLSYLQAALLTKDLNDYGGFWHGQSQYRIIPFVIITNKNNEDGCIEWDMLEPEPESWEPRVYMEDGSPTIVFYEWKFAYNQWLYESTWTFDRTGYTSALKRKEIARGGMGIMF